MDVTSLEWIKSSKQLLDLPPEVFLQIVEQLPPENAALLALTTKCLYHEPRLQRLWRPEAHRDPGPFALLISRHLPD
jgi:hypothetical protein